jgi:hypothetical protein
MASAARSSPGNVEASIDRSLNSRLPHIERKEAGPCLSINSAFRSDAEQARLFAAKPVRLGAIGVLST